MQTQYSVLDYRVDFYFHDDKLAIEIDENGHSVRIIDYEIKRQKAIKQELGCDFIRTDPDKEDFDIFKANNEIFRYIKRSSNELIKKSFTDKILIELLGLEFKSDNKIRSKAIIYIVKKITPLWVKLFHFISYKNNGNVLRWLYKKVLQTKILVSEELNKIE